VKTVQIHPVKVVTDVRSFQPMARMLRGVVMQGMKLAAAAFFAALGMAAGLAVAPIALADDCDPTATICEGDVNTAPPAAAPTVSASDEQYPLDEDWYFNPAGGGTELQPQHPSGGGASGGGAAAGGGGHR
jgi:hypothetical protein